MVFSTSDAAAADPTRARSENGYRGASVTLDKDSVEQILARAAELTTLTESEGEQGLTPEQLGEVAGEVGIPVAAVAAALAERRVGVTDGSGLLDRLVGPRRLWQRRQAVVDDFETDDIESWLRVAHGLRTRVRDDGVVVAGPRQDLVARISATVRRVQGQGRLGRARRIEAVAVELVDEPAVICLVADAGNKRNEAVAAGSAVATVGVGVVAVGAVLTGPVILVTLPLAAGAGTIVSRMLYRSTVEELSDELTMTIDGLARGEHPPSVLRSVTDRLRRR